MGLDVDVRIVGDIEDDLDDGPAREREPRLVQRAHRIATVVADAQSLAAQREVTGHRLQFTLRHDLVVDVQLQRTVELVMVAHAVPW